MIVGGNKLTNSCWQETTEFLLCDIGTLAKQENIKKIKLIPIANHVHM
jgi:hypothetical protein